MGLNSAELIACSPPFAFDLIQITITCSNMETSVDSDLSNLLVDSK